jgi:hypothetical protein
MFQLNSYEMDSDIELDHLRNLIEIFLLSTFGDQSYFRNTALRTLFKEILLNKGLEQIITEQIILLK